MFKFKLLCVDFFVSEEELIQREGRERRRKGGMGRRGIFLHLFNADDKIPQGGRVPRAPPAIFASSLSSGKNPVDTIMIFAIRLFCPKQMFPGHVPPFAV